MSEQSHGNHTWDMIIEYDCCPKCQYIFENREKFEHRLGILQKDLVCPRCQQRFTITKKRTATFGPLWGDDT